VVLGICSGEFLETTKEDFNEYDCVVTCFFLDTANNIIEYVL